MPFSLRGLRASLAVLLVVGLAACGDDDNTNPPATPPAPTGLTATPSGDGSSIEVSWTAVTGATSYVLERAEGTPPGTYAAIGGDLTATTYTDTDIELDVAYSYRVAAVNDEGTGSFSSAVTAGVEGEAVDTLTGNITRRPDAVRRHALRPERVREGRQRRDADDRAGHHDHRRRGRGRQLALDPPRRPDPGGGHCRRPDRLHLGPGRWARARPATGAGS